ncbi:MAG: DASS family sodium-coupled anion symporter [Negativicutes bacterium]|nr:DASS family sodium-coupled anion symporter [Negativicutes bacterium]
MSKWVKLAVVVAVPVIMLLFPPPTGLSLPAWQLLSVYLGAVVGLVLRPFPEPVIFLAAVAAVSILMKNTQVLEGYAEGVPWLIFCAFMIGTAFIKTGLGLRIAYYLIRVIGRTPLGLGYVATLTDTLLSPAIPSNAARTGGVVFPIIRSIALALDSEPGPSARRIGSYLMVLAYQVSLTTGYFVITGVAPNLLTVKFAATILHVNIDWMMWFYAAIVPAGLMLLLEPYIVYKLYPPELKVIDNKRLAAEGLAKLGPMSGKEKILMTIFVFAIIGWMTGSMTKIDAPIVAIAALAVCVMAGVLAWEDVLSAHGGWNTLIWYGGIMGLASGLQKAKFFDWMAKVLGANLNFSGQDPMLILTALVVISLAIRYFFASGGAYIATMVPLFYTIGYVSHVPVIPLAFGIGFSAVYGSLLTHYGSAAGPIIFSAGYVDQTTWWKIGHVIVLVSALVTLGIGIPYWKLIGLSP